MPTRRVVLLLLTCIAAAVRGHSASPLCMSFTLPAPTYSGVNAVDSRIRDLVWSWSNCCINASSAFPPRSSSTRFGADRAFVVLVGAPVTPLLAGAERANISFIFNNVAFAAPPATSLVMLGNLPVDGVIRDVAISIENSAMTHATFTLVTVVDSSGSRISMRVVNSVISVAGPFAGGSSSQAGLLHWVSSATEPASLLNVSIEGCNVTQALYNNSAAIQAPGAAANYTLQSLVTVSDKFSRPRNVSIILVASQVRLFITALDGDPSTVPSTPQATGGVNRFASSCVFSFQDAQAPPPDAPSDDHKSVIVMRITGSFLHLESTLRAYVLLCYSSVISGLDMEWSRTNVTIRVFGYVVQADESIARAARVILAGTLHRSRITLDRTSISASVNAGAEIGYANPKVGVTFCGVIVADDLRDVTFLFERGHVNCSAERADLSPANGGLLATISIIHSIVASTQTNPTAVNASFVIRSATLTSWLSPLIQASFPNLRIFVLRVSLVDAGLKVAENVSMNILNAHVAINSDVPAALRESRDPKWVWESRIIAIVALQGTNVMGSGYPLKTTAVTVVIEGSSVTTAFARFWKDAVVTAINGQHMQLLLTIHNVSVSNAAVAQLPPPTPPSGWSVIGFVGRTALEQCTVMASGFNRSMRFLGIALPLFEYPALQRPLTEISYLLSTVTVNEAALGGSWDASWLASTAPSLLMLKDGGAAIRGVVAFSNTTFNIKNSVFILNATGGLLDADELPSSLALPTGGNVRLVTQCSRLDNGVITPHQFRQLPPITANTSASWTAFVDSGSVFLVEDTSCPLVVTDVPMVKPSASSVLSLPSAIRGAVIAFAMVSVSGSSAGGIGSIQLANAARRLAMACRDDKDIDGDDDTPLLGDVLSNPLQIAIRGPEVPAGAEFVFGQVVGFAVMCICLFPATLTIFNLAVAVSADRRHLSYAGLWRAFRASGGFVSSFAAPFLALLQPTASACAALLAMSLEYGSSVWLCGLVGAGASLCIVAVVAVWVHQIAWKWNGDQFPFEWRLTPAPCSNCRSVGLIPRLMRGIEWSPRHSFSGIQRSWLQQYIVLFDGSRPSRVWYFGLSATLDLVIGAVTGSAFVMIIAADGPSDACQMWALWTLVTLACASMSLSCILRPQKCWIEWYVALVIGALGLVSTLLSASSPSSGSATGTIGFVQAGIGCTFFLIGTLQQAAKSACSILKRLTESTNQKVPLYIPGEAPMNDRNDAVLARDSRWILWRQRRIVSKISSAGTTAWNGLSMESHRRDLQRLIEAICRQSGKRNATPRERE